jgi:hypothetical protein
MMLERLSGRAATREALATLAGDLDADRCERHPLHLGKGFVVPATRMGLAWDAAAATGEYGDGIPELAPTR